MVGEAEPLTLPDHTNVKVPEPPVTVGDREIEVPVQTGDSGDTPTDTDVGAVTPVTVMVEVAVVAHPVLVTAKPITFAPATTL